MEKNAPLLTIKEFDSCGYDYRAVQPDGKTFGYFNRDSRGKWTFYLGGTPSEAATSDTISFEGYTLNELKDELAC